jgi:O-antigen/teichoic acid export membrane protein
MLGNNNSIIFNSKYYRTVLLLGLCLVVLTVSLNMYFIPNFGIEGAAIATLISIGLYSIAKFLFVVFKMDLFPFSKKTIVSLGIIALTFIVFYFWNFSFHPILNIVLKSVLISLFYWFLNYKCKTSDDINGVIKGFFAKF